MEVEFSRIPTKNMGANSIANKKRKEDLEFEIELNQKNINMIKQKLREMNAL